MSTCRTSAGKLITIVAVLVVFFARRRVSDRRGALRHPFAGVADGQAAEARARPEGRRPPRPARADRRCAAAPDRDGDGAAARGADRRRDHRRPSRRPTQTHFRVEGVPPAQDAAFRQAADDSRTTNFDRSAGADGTYTFTMKPNIQVNLREEAVVQARQTIERRVNELGVTEPSIAQQGAGGDQILVQLPGVTDVERAKEIIRSTGLLELKIVEQGPAATARSADAEQPGAAPGMEIIPGASGDARRRGARCTTWCARSAAVTGRDLRNARPSLDENNQPAVSFTLNNEGGRKFGKVTSENIGRQLAIVLDGRVQSAPRIDGAHHHRRPHHRQLHAGRSAEPLADPAFGRAAGAAHLSRGADDRAEPRRRLDSLGRHRVGRRPAAHRRLHAGLLQAVGRQRGRRAHLQPDHPARADGVYRRGDDAAGHRRLRADDGHRRRFERADLRAHQRGARSAARRARRRSTPGSAACSGRCVDTHIAALISAAFLFQFGTGPDSRFRRDAVHRPAVEPVHVDLRLEDAV